MDLRTVGERLREVRLLLGLTQQQLASATHLTQPTVSRLENGEEVYASVLLAVLTFYRGKVSLDALLAPDFQASDAQRALRRREEARHVLVRQLDTVADMLATATESSLAQLELLKKQLR